MRDSTEEYIKNCNLSNKNPDSLTLLVMNLIDHTKGMEERIKQLEESTIKDRDGVRVRHCDPYSDNCYITKEGWRQE